MTAWTAALVATSLAAALFTVTWDPSQSPLDYEVSRYRLDLRTAGSATTAYLQVDAVATRTISTLEMAYCGPRPLFMAVDGSSVGAERQSSGLRAELHRPIAPDQEFSVRVLATGTATEMLCLD